jgi:parallel beta-helix repeat protein
MRILAIVALLATSVHGAVITVNPGPGAIQAAIDGASPGDTLLVMEGAYEESIVVDKRLKILCYSSAIVTLDAGCTASTAIKVEADDVVIAGLRVTGGTVYGVDIQNRDHIFVNNVVVTGTCPGVLYGINVYQSTRIKLLRNRTTNFADAGIYVGAIPVGGRVRMLDNISNGNVRGILLEDSPFGSRLIARRNVVDSNTDGIFLNNTAGASVTRSYLTLNSGNGIWLNASSSDNRLRGNDISSSGGQDALDEGTSNCWQGNSCEDTSCPDASGCP